MAKTLLIENRSKDTRRRTSALAMTCFSISFLQDTIFSLPIICELSFYDSLARVYILSSDNLLPAPYYISTVISHASYNPLTPSKWPVMVCQHAFFFSNGTAACAKSIDKPSHSSDAIPLMP